MIINEFTTYRVMAITLGLSAEWTNHLRVTGITGFADIDIATFQLQSGVRLKAFNRYCCVLDKEQRNNFSKTTETDHNHNQDCHQADILFYYFMTHSDSPNVLAVRLHRRSFLNRQ